MIRLAAVDTSDEKIVAVLRRLQRETLPSDRVYDVHRGQWWIAYEGTHPVAFGGVVQSVQWIDTGYLCRAGVVASHRGRGLQKRLIRVRERYARNAAGWNWLVTETSHDNVQSANSLIACGYRMFNPSRPWGLRGANYWRKPLKG